MQAFDRGKMHKKRLIKMSSGSKISSTSSLKYTLFDTDITAPTVILTELTFLTFNEAPQLMSPLRKQLR
jgi:hypothetical protein